MSLAITLLFSFIAGFLGHMTRPIVKRDFKPGWFEIVSYALGVLLGLPFVILTDSALDGIADRKNRLITAYLLAFGGIGAGTLVGFYYLPDERLDMLAGMNPGRQTVPHVNGAQHGGESWRRTGTIDPGDGGENQSRGIAATG